MKRILTALAIAAPLLAACGPDCEGYCNKLITCGEISPTDLTLCRTGCDNVGGDQVATINCVIDKSCQEIAADVCRLAR